MVARHAHENPLAATPYLINDVVSLRIPKKNRLASQQKRLICRISEERYPDRYKLLSEYGPLRGLFSRSELDSTPASVQFVPPSAVTSQEITLNAASRFDRERVHQQVS